LIPIIERVAGVYTNYFLALNSCALSLTPDW